MKIPGLVNLFRKAALGTRQDEVYDDFTFTDHFEAIDPSIWKADEAYQLYWSDSYLNTYLLFWDDRIVELKFYWDPTPEQIEIAIQKLMP